VIATVTFLTNISPFHDVVALLKVGRNQAEKVGAYSFATVKSASGKSVTFQAEVQVPVNNHNVQPNGPRVIMQVVPQFKHVSFLGGGQFKAAVMDYETKSYDTTNNLQTGIVAFFAHKVSINGASPAVSADKVGFKGGVSRGVKAQDAKSTSISGGNNGEKGTGSGHNRRGGHGGKGTVLWVVGQHAWCCARILYSRTESSAE
jgi:hypothetical protein